MFFFCVFRLLSGLQRTPNIHIRPAFAYMCETKDDQNSKIISEGRPKKRAVTTFDVYFIFHTISGLRIIIMCPCNCSMEHVCESHSFSLFPSFSLSYSSMIFCCIVGSFSQLQRIFCIYVRRMYRLEYHKLAHNSIEQSNVWSIE